MTSWDSEVRAILADAGADGWIHAAVIGHPDQCVGMDSDSPVVLGSMYKLYVMVAVCRAADARSLDLSDRVTVDPALYPPGPTGLAGFADPVTLSLRDLTRLMMTVSDNTAAAVLLTALPAGALEETLAVLEGAGGAREWAHVQRGGGDWRPEQWGAHDWDDAAHHLAHEPDGSLGRVANPAYVLRGTPRSLCRLMDAIWSDSAASSGMCSFMREVLGQQAWRHRIASGFPQQTFRVFGKTGTVGQVRAETALVEPDGEIPIAVCVATRAARADASLPRVDAAIGRVARIAVDHLRMGAVQV